MKLVEWLRPSGSGGRCIPPWVSGFALGLVVFMFMQPTTGVDVLVTYGPAGRGEPLPDAYYPRNPYFARWLLWLIGRLPWRWDYLALMLVSVPILAAAVYWGKGDYRKAFLSFPFVWLLAYGQIDGFVAAGIALAWYALKQERFWLMGVGLSFACLIKPQMGVFAAICLWLWSPDKWRPLAVPTLLGVISLLQWGWDWPVRWIQFVGTLVEALEANWANTSPIPWLGWWSLLIWVPVLLVPMERLVRLRSVLAATAFSWPYFPAYQLIILLPFPLSWIEWLLSGLPFLGKRFYAATILFPLLVITVSVWPWISARIRQWMECAHPSA